MKTCGICSHPERAAIDAALVARTSVRVLAGRYGTSKSALDRHRKCIPAALVKAKEATDVADAGTLLSRINQLVSRCERIYDGAINEGEWSGAVGAARELRGCLELLAKLSGELRPAKITLNTQINNNARQAGHMTNAEIEAEILELFGLGLICSKCRRPSKPEDLIR